MRALIQRVTKASVSSEGQETQSIANGFVILLGVSHTDTNETAEKLWNKISKLRIFEDEHGKTNLSLKDVEGEILLVSQFTLYANCEKGNRPSFTDAGKPEEANRLFEYMTELIRKDHIPIKTGWFGAMMNVSLINDGPFTIWLDTDQL